MAKRIDETPVRRVTGIIRDEKSPGTPAQDTGRRQGGRLIVPADIGVQKFAARFRRLLGVASASPVDGYRSDLVAAVLLNTLNPEDLYPEEILRSGTTQVNPAGGQLGQAVLFNQTSGRNAALLVLNGIFVTLTVADILQVRWGNAALGAVSGASYDDARQSVTSNNDGFLSTNVAAAVAGGVGNAFETYAIPANQLPFNLQGPFIIPPGISLSINQSTAGVAQLLAAWKWRVVPIPQG